MPNSCVLHILHSWWSFVPKQFKIHPYTLELQPGHHFILWPWPWPWPLTYTPESCVLHVVVNWDTFVPKHFKIHPCMSELQSGHDSVYRHPSIRPSIHPTIRPSVHPYRQADSSIPPLTSKGGIIKYRIIIFFWLQITIFEEYSHFYSLIITKKTKVYRDRVE